MTSLFRNMPICNKFYEPYNDKKLNLNRLKSAQARQTKNYYGRVGFLDQEKGEEVLSNTQAQTTTINSGPNAKDSKSRNETLEQ